MTFFVWGFWGPFLFFVVFGLQRPFLEKFIYSRCNDFWQGSFLILWLFCLRLLRPFFVFCFFQASEALYGKTFLLEVVTIFDKDHFSFNDFFLLRPFFVFCCFWASEALFGKIYLFEVVTIFDKDHFSFYDFFVRGFWGPFLFFVFFGPQRPFTEKLIFSRW